MLKQLVEAAAAQFKRFLENELFDSILHDVRSRESTRTWSVLLLTLALGRNLRLD